MPKKSSHNKLSKNLHPRNIHGKGYNFEQLIKVLPELGDHLTKNKVGKTTINFSSPLSVKLLNKALLISHYELSFWDIPEGYLCPPVPGRSDYLNYVADLMASINDKVIPKGQKIRCLDIGVGANCIYPIIGHKMFKWSFVGSDIDKTALKNAKHILDKNPKLKPHLELRWQQKSHQVLKGVCSATEYFDLVICNPPFHTSQAEASAANTRKTRNLSQGKVSSNRNFGGQANELWCEGGEKRFISTMIDESQAVARNCFLFTSLLSNKKHEAKLILRLKKAKATVVEVLPMVHANKSSRILCWTFLTDKQQKIWIGSRWK